MYLHNLSNSEVKAQEVLALGFKTFFMRNSTEHDIPTAH